MIHTQTAPLERLEIAEYTMGKLGEVILQAMSSGGLTQNQVAQKAGLTSGAISKIITGTSKRPHLDTLGRIAGALSIDSQILIAALNEDLAILNERERIMIHTIPDEVVDDFIAQLKEEIHNNPPILAKLRRFLRK